MTYNYLTFLRKASNTTEVAEPAVTWGGEIGKKYQFSISDNAL